MNPEARATAEDGLAKYRVVYSVKLGELLKTAITTGDV